MSDPELPAVETKKAKRDTSQDEPASSQEKLVFGQEEPASSPDESVSIQGEPSSMQGEPSSSQDETSSSHDEPSSSEDKPVSNQEEPVSDSEEPASSSPDELVSIQGEPSSSPGEPSSSLGEPSSSLGEPVSSQGEPASSQDDSASIQGEPSSSQQGPMSSQMKPEPCESTSNASDDNEWYLEKYEVIVPILLECSLVKNVVKMECFPGSKKGDNYMSAVKRIAISSKTEDDQEYTVSFIIKRPIPNKSTFNFYGCEQLFANEIKAYRNVVPVLNQHLDAEVFPKFYYADGQLENKIMIFEDLCESGYALRPRLEALGPKDIDAVLREMSRIHAVSIYMKHFDETTFNATCLKIQDIVYSAERFKLYQGIIHSAIAGAMQALRKNNSDGSLDPAINALESIGPKLFETIQEYVLSSDHKLNVITHGDIWTNNIFFRDESDGAVNVKFIDLQAMRYASPIFDIMHLVYISTERKLPENSIESIIGTYCQHLHKHIDRLFGEKHTAEAERMKARYHYDVILQQHKAYALYGLAIAMWVLPAVTFADDNIPDLTKIAEKRKNPKEIEMKEMLTPRYSELLKQVIAEMMESGHLVPPTSSSAQQK